MTASQDLSYKENQITRDQKLEELKDDLEKIKVSQRNQDLFESKLEELKSS